MMCSLLFFQTVERVRGLKHGARDKDIVDRHTTAKNHKHCPREEVEAVGFILLPCLPHHRMMMMNSKKQTPPHPADTYPVSTTEQLDSRNISAALPTRAPIALLFVRQDEETGCLPGTIMVE